MIFTFLIVFLTFNAPDNLPEKSVNETSESLSGAQSIYQELNNKHLPFEAFEMAYNGWLKLKDSVHFEKNIITLVDFSQPSTHKRFFLIDIDSKSVIYQNYVAHGKNSGMLNAEKFSNIANSNQSSLGFYKTGETYYGKHGLSLKLDGLEKGINDKARERHIVIHKADYAEESFIKKYGRLGRSFGCPAIPSANYQFVIDNIKEGTMLFIYHPKATYIKTSSILN
ncbi:murein L,D-transpeptidase catalytic domain family protein [Carboxylicivirga mesophila]|uniref:Murein L,D-transpeptidase catalytic domain family protein n=1 Tax=Carboxylicivirga mesophila TaxID=1166478 RepID=A0ABS5K6I5_9BACT|nr:murein L,D-transpeptidase catalytic domain family protein [Carboxylicivirga mesophila]MBS2210121.1 murein L,D-transpeptidase catalytic domain family protein [Carboxylicivirga mesophila]